MRFELPELHDALRETLARFVERGDLARFDELELWGLMLPESAGGAEMDALAYVVVLEALAEANPSLAHRFALHAGPASAALAASEIDLAPVARGALASWMDGKRAPRARWLAVSTDALRIYDEPPATAAPLMALDDASISTFDLGEPVATIEDAPTRARVAALADLGFAACCVGAARASLRAATAYAKERKQFERPIADFQAIQWKIADAATELDAAQLLVRAAASDLSRAAQARVFSGSAAGRAASEALQIHGGYGYTREYPVEGWLRAIRIWSANPDAARLR